MSSMYEIDDANAQKLDCNIHAGTQAALATLTRDQNVQFAVSCSCDGCEKVSTLIAFSFLTEAAQQQETAC